MTGWEHELLRFLNGTRGVELFVAFAVAGVAVVFGKTVKHHRSSYQRSPLQRLDGLMIAATLLPLAVCQLVKIDDQTPVLAYGSSVVLVGFSCLLMVLLAANWRTTLPVIVIGLLLSLFHKPMSRDIARHGPMRPPLWERIRISTAGDLSGVDLWLNGERIDSLPLEIKTADLAAKVPKGRFRDELPGYSRLLYEDEYRCLGKWYTHAEHRGIIEPWGYFSFHFFDKNGQNKSKSPRVGATINGVQAFPIYGIGDHHAGAAVSFFDSNNMKHVLLDVRTVEWEDELTRLADIARVSDYHVDSAWCDAVLSYQPRGWYYIRELVPFEPAFHRILDQLARRAYRVDEIASTNVAWTKLLEISDYFHDRGHYDSRSLEAKALEFVAAKVSPRRLTAECGNLLVDDYDRLVEYVTHSRGVAWITADKQYSPGRVRKTVFGYAAWCLDKALDEQNPDHENVLEKWLTPRLLSHRDYQSAGIIGGPAWQNYRESNLRLSKYDLKEFTDLSGIGYMHRGVRGLVFPSASGFIKLREKDLHKNGPQNLRELMEFDRYHDEAVEVLAQHANVEFRSAALLAIRYHPTPRRRKVLEQLLRDEDPRIKAEAVECQAQIDELRHTPLPYRQMPQKTDEPTDR